MKKILHLGLIVLIGISVTRSSHGGHFLEDFVGFAANDNSFLKEINLGGEGNLGLEEEKVSEVVEQSFQDFRSVSIIKILSYLGNKDIMVLRRTSGSFYRFLMLYYRALVDRLSKVEIISQLTRELPRVIYFNEEKLINKAFLRSKIIKGDYVYCFNDSRTALIEGGFVAKTAKVTVLLRIKTSLGKDFIISGVGVGKCVKIRDTVRVSNDGNVRGIGSLFEDGNIIETTCILSRSGFWRSLSFGCANALRGSD